MAGVYRSVLQPRGTLVAISCSYALHYFQRRVRSRYTNGGDSKCMGYRERAESEAQSKQNVNREYA